MLFLLLRLLLLLHWIQFILKLFDYFNLEVSIEWYKSRQNSLASEHFVWDWNCATILNSKKKKEKEKEKPGRCKLHLWNLASLRFIETLKGNMLWISCKVLEGSKTSQNLRPEYYPRQDGILSNNIWHACSIHDQTKILIVNLISCSASLSLSELFFVLYLGL